MQRARVFCRSSQISRWNPLLRSGKRRMYTPFHRHYSQTSRERDYSAYIIIQAEKRTIYVNMARDDVTSSVFSLLIWIIRSNADSGTRCAWLTLLAETAEVCWHRFPSSYSYSWVSIGSSAPSSVASSTHVNLYCFKISMFRFKTFFACVCGYKSQYS